MTSLIPASETILKTDQRGRVRMPPERREALLLEFERSGLSGAEYARVVGVRYSTFAAWVARRKRGDASRRRSGGRERFRSKSSASRSGVAWVEAVVEPHRNRHDASGSLVVDLPGGARTRVSNATQAGLLARVLTELDREGKGRAAC